MYASVILMVMIKKLFYILVAVACGLEYFTDQDDSYHFDMKANQTNIPCIFVTDKPKEMGCPVEHMKVIFDRLDVRHRTFCKPVKVLGKWFFQIPKT